MTKALQPIGDNLGLIIDKPILSSLGITESTPLEISVTEDGRIETRHPTNEAIRKLEPAHDERFKWFAPFGFVRYAD